MSSREWRELAVMLMGVAVGGLTTLSMFWVAQNTGDEFWWNPVMLAFTFVSILVTAIIINMVLLPKVVEVVFE